MENLRFLIFNWLIRVLAIASVFFLLLFIISDLSYVSRSSLSEILQFVFFPIGVIAGLLLGIKFELTGSIISIFSLFAFYLLHYLIEKTFPNGIAFMIFTSPALFYLLSWLIKSKKS